MRFCVSLVIAAVVVSTSFAQDEPAKDKLNIYILVGQSNMAGRAKIEEEDKKLPKNLFLLDSKGKWVPASHPFVQYTNIPNGADDRVNKSGGTSGLNFGLTFARRMMEANPDAAIGLVVNPQGGSAIETWKKGAKNYDKTMERIRPIQNTGQIRGVLWHQGESNLKLGEAHPEALVKVVEQFRTDLGNPKLPFVAGQIAPLPKQIDTIKVFNKAILNLPTLIPHTAVVQADDLSGKDIHFDSKDTRTLGKRYAEEMLKLQAK